MNSRETQMELTMRWEDQTQYWRNFVLWVMQEHDLRPGQSDHLWKAINLHLAHYGLRAIADGFRRTIVGSQEDFLAWQLTYS